MTIIMLVWVNEKKKKNGWDEHDLNIQSYEN